MMERSLLGKELGNYRLVSLLGRGGFAEVYLGEHKRLHRSAAIKVLHAYLSEKEVAGFQREAGIIANLDHPHIARVLDFDIQQGIAFLVMEYYPDGSLRQRHPKGERVPLATIISYVKQVASALQYAHDQRLIHRDVKPDNMLVGRHQDILLSDFGIVAMAHSTSSMGTQDSAGTFPYMAPEQIQAHPRPASDQYALGVVVYEWLCGKRPFEGTIPELIAKHLSTQPLSLRQTDPLLSPEVEQVVLRALAKEPQQRFPTIQAFADALEEASQVKNIPPISDTRPSSLPTLSRGREETTISVKLEQELEDTPPVQPPPVVSLSIDKPSQTELSQTEPARPPRQVSSPPERRFSRRTALIGLATSVVVAGGGAVAYWLYAPHPLVTYRGHSSFVYSVAWSPDGNRIASASQDNTVQVWNAADGSHPFTYHGHSNAVYSVAWSPDSKRLASASADGTVQIWNAADGSRPYVYRGHSSYVNAVAWSPDGKRIASASGDNTVQVWDAADGNHPYTYRGHSNVVHAVAWSPDDTRIASASYDGTVQIWDAVDGSHPFTYRGHSSDVYAVAWSPHGSLIASGSGDNTVQVWNAP